MMAVKAAREWARQEKGIARPEIIGAFLLGLRGWDRRSAGGRAGEYAPVGLEIGCLGAQFAALDFAREVEKRHAKDHMTVVFSTYHSIAVIHDTVRAGNAALDNEDLATAKSK